MNVSSKLIHLKNFCTK